MNTNHLRCSYDRPIRRRLVVMKGYILMRCAAFHQGRDYCNIDRVTNARVWYTGKHTFHEPGLVSCQTLEDVSL